MYTGSIEKIIDNLKLAIEYAENKKQADALEGCKRTRGPGTAASHSVEGQ